MSQASPPSPEPAKPILIVDDEEIVLVAMRDTLVRAGYTVVASPHAVHALSVLKEQVFSVVITDQQMPMVSGLEFLAQVRQTQPDATRILITAVLNISTLIDSINKAEIYRFVVKPWSREDLLASVKCAVERFESVSQSTKILARTLTLNRQLQQKNQLLEVQAANLTRELAQMRGQAGSNPPPP